MSIGNEREERYRPTVEFDPQEARTKQEFLKETNINEIMNKYLRKGILTHLNHAEPNYGFVPSMDFQEALETVRDSQDAFMALPGEVRKAFGNDPMQFLQEVENPESEAKLVELGLIEAAETQEPVGSEASGETPAEPAE